MDAICVKNSACTKTIQAARLASTLSAHVTIGATVSPLADTLVKDCSIGKTNILSDASASVLAPVRIAALRTVECVRVSYPRNEVVQAAKRSAATGHATQLL